MRKCVSQRSEDLDSLLFSCTQYLVGGTASGVFESLGREIPQHIAEPNAEIDWPCGFDESILGYIYQIRQMSSRDALQARVQQPDKKTSSEDLIAFTQLYTPDWVVKFLVERAVSCTVGGTVSGADATVVDPACGSGHFLLQAVDTIFDARRLHGESAADAMRHALTQISGYDIDPTGLFIARLALTIKALKHLPLAEIPTMALHNVGHDPLGSLAKDAIKQKFDAVVGNPPYIGRKLLHRQLKEKLKREYPTSHSDLCTAFLARGLELLKPGGKLAFITQSSMLYLPSYEGLRKSILQNHRLDCVVEAGTHVFPLQSGEKVNSVLLVVQQGQDNSAPSEYLDLTQVDEKESALAQALFVQRDQCAFQSFRASAFNFACPPSFQILREKSERLRDHADIRQGLATTDNARFVRLRCQVPPEEIGTRWIPYAKGSGSERWFAPIDSVVDWADNGAAIKEAVATKYPYLNGEVAWVVKNEQYYLREGLTFSFVNSKTLAVRWLPPGCIFDVGGSALFCDEPFFLLAYLNSSLISACARHLNPTINFQVGDLKELPYIQFPYSTRCQLADLARQCVNLKQEYFRLKASGAVLNQIATDLRQTELIIDRLVLERVPYIEGLPPAP